MARAVRELDDTYFAERRIRVDYVSTVSWNLMWHGALTWILAWNVTNERVCTDAHL